VAEIMSDKQKKSKSRRSRSEARLVNDDIVVPRVLPRGTNSLPKDVVLISQRSRLIEATAHCVAEKGYADTSVADIIRRAGVSRTTFYQQFKDKEDCFLYCFEQLSGSHLEEMFVANTLPRPAPYRLVQALQVYLERLADDGVYAVAFFAEASNGGERVQVALSRTTQAIIDQLQGWYADVRTARPDLPVLPELVFQLISDGIYAVLTRWIRDGHSNQLLDVLPALTYFVFSALGLHDWAAKALGGDTFDAL
jgi:AcrR family transcriptional regulator